MTDKSLEIVGLFEGRASGGSYLFNFLEAFEKRSIFLSGLLTCGSKLLHLLFQI